MKKIIYSLIFIVSISFSGNKLFAQHIKVDDTEERFQALAKKDPALLQKRAELEKRTADYIASHPENGRNRNPVPRIIPVVVHVLHEGGAENISKAQILDQIRITNEDLRRLNPDTGNTPAAFKPVAADCNIELKLAQLDPNGYCTDGIDRIVTPLTNNADVGSFINQWPPNNYLNIWVVSTIASGTLGFTNYPGGIPANDGIICVQNYFGTIGTAVGNNWNGRILTALFGLYMNVRHIWGDDAGYCWGDDLCADTPNQGNSSTGCPTYPQYDSCTSTGSGIMFMNFLDFTDGSCMNLFTQDQAARMNAILDTTVSGRSNLASPANLIATGTDGTPPVVCVPIADFSVSKHRICLGDSVFYSNTSFNADSIISYSWNFPGGIPSTSNLASTYVYYPAPGIYDASLSVTGLSGTDSITYVSIVTVSGANLTPYFSDDFETAGTFPGIGGAIENGGNNAFTWSRVTGVVGSSGSACLKMTNNASNLSGSVDSWITPSFDLTDFNLCQLRFKLAYSQFHTSNTDLLTVYYSTNCGASWTPRFVKSGATLATTTYHAINFIPDSLSQWRQEFTALGAANGKSNVSFKFEFTAGPDNNLYIDDIEVTGNYVGIDELNRNNLDLSVFPNPTNSDANISFTILKQSKTEISLFDVTGREVKKIVKGILDTGAHSYYVNTTEMSKGIYIVKLKAGEITDMKKLVVE